MCFLLISVLALNPTATPVQTINVGQLPTPVRLHTPSDDAVFEAIMAKAHAQASADPENYDAIMEEHCSGSLTAKPAYWAQVWPSAVAVGERLLSEPELVKGKQVLEVGAGLGLASICAALAGAAAVVTTDVEPDAVAFAEANAAENGVGDLVCGEVLDWSAPQASSGGMFDVIIAADVVYDEVALRHLARLLHGRVAKAGGLVLLADNADRPYESRRRSALLELCCEQGEFQAVGAEESTRVSLSSRQGESFVISTRVLQRL